MVSARARNPLIDWPCPAVANADLSVRTTMRVGGTAEWLLEPSHPDEFVAAYKRAREHGITPRVLGGGANLLIADGVLPGVVIATGRMSRVFRPPVEGAEIGDDDALQSELPGLAVLDREADPRLVAWAGSGMPGIVRATRDLGWSGFEGLIGVPGNLGGGVAMNAGGRWGNLWDVVESVRVLTREGEVQHLDRADCQPTYRNANLGDRIVLGAVLRFQVKSRAEVKAAMDQFLREKSQAQPVTEHSSGCIFKNPDPERSGGKGAGLLVDECGGKGRERGAAIVSPKHGNFIVNRGGARAEDVLGLMEDLRALVAERTGIVLETEVRLWN